MTTNFTPINRTLYIQKCKREDMVGQIALPEGTQENTNFGVIRGVSSDCHHFGCSEVGAYCVFPDSMVRCQRLDEATCGEESWVVDEEQMSPCVVEDDGIVPLDDHVLLTHEDVSRDVGDIKAPEDIWHDSKYVVVRGGGEDYKPGERVELVWRQGHEYTHIKHEDTTYAVVHKSDIVGVYQ